MNFTEYVKEFDKDFLNNNFEQIVRDFNKNDRENNPNTRKVKPPILLPSKLKPSETLTYRVLFRGATFEDYKADFEQRIQIPDTDKNIVIEDYLNTYINRPLKDKNTNVRSIYKDIKTGKTPNYFVSITNKYLYYTNRHSVFELIKFEDFLNNQTQQPEKGKDKNTKYIWKSTHALSEFYKKVNDNFFEDLSLDDFLDVFTESNKMRLNAINFNQTDIGYLFDNVKPYFIDKIQANYLDWISTKVLFNGKEKKPKAISEILNFHKSKKVEYKESIDEILKSLKPFIT